MPKSSKPPVQPSKWTWTYWIPEGTDPMESKKIIDKYLKLHSKKWTYQLEKGEQSGRLHFQGRATFKSGCRNPGEAQIKFGELHMANLAYEHNTEKSEYYCMKEDTRVDGPWTDKMEPVFIPRQLQEIGKLYDWQDKVIDLSKTWDTRHIHVIVDPSGNKGKSTLVTYMGVHGLGKQLPFCNDFKDLLRMCYDVGPKPAYLIDMPRAIAKNKLHQLYGAIESIKSGYCYDERYEFKDRYFNCPNIFIFSNVPPDLDLLSVDRWVIWTIKDLKLVPYLQLEK
jgi:hypothetical protein